MDYSIIIPMFNAAGTVGAQLDALAAQHVPASWQVVVSDNGSTDASREVVEAYRGKVPGLEVVDSSERRGPSYARNVGVAAANGEFLLFVDADDVVAPGWFAAVHRAVQAGAEFVGGGFDLSALAHTTPLEPRAPRIDRFPPFLGFLDWALSANLGIRRDIFDQLGGWDTSIERGEDVEFSWRAQLAGYALTFVPDAVVQYRLRDDVRGFLRQQWGNGESYPLLLRRFAPHGARREPAKAVLGRYARLLRSSPALLGPQALRWRWLGEAAVQSGRLWGSVRFRTFCP